MAHLNFACATRAAPLQVQYTACPHSAGWNTAQETGGKASISYSTLGDLLGGKLTPTPLKVGTAMDQKQREAHYVTEF